MTDSSRGEPPRDVRYTLDETLALLADLEDVRDVLIDDGYLVPLMGNEMQIRLLSRKLGFDDTEGEADEH